MPDAERTRLLSAMETELADVELALARLDAGTYDRCEVCNSQIDDETSAATPTSRRCRGCLESM